MEKNKVVVIGGGTGTFTVLTGLSAHDELDLSAIVTMADDGGSNKVLRDEFGLLPTSGVRQCIVALSKNKGRLRELFSYRYSQGKGISGMTFGNLFMAAMTDIVGDARQAIRETCQLLDVRGQILPVSYQKTSLVATYQDGTQLTGEHEIDVSNTKVSDKRITALATIPAVSLDFQALKAIESAELIVIGPGDLYTNTIACLVVKGMKEALIASRARIVFVMNLMTKRGETYNYQASDFLEDLSQYLPAEQIDYVIVNSDITLSAQDLTKYASEGSIPVKDNLKQSWNKTRIIRTPLLSRALAQPQKGDLVARSLVRHDPNLLASALFDLLD